MFSMFNEDMFKSPARLLEEHVYMFGKPKPKPKAPKSKKTIKNRNANKAASKARSK